MGMRPSLEFWNLNNLKEAAHSPLQQDPRGGDGDSLGRRPRPAPLPQRRSPQSKRHSRSFLLVSPLPVFGFFFLFFFWGEGVFFSGNL